MSFVFNHALLVISTLLANSTGNLITNWSPTVMLQELFQPLELQAMVIGNENYDWVELEKVRYCLYMPHCMSHIV